MSRYRLFVIYIIFLLAVVEIVSHWVLASNHGYLSIRAVLLNTANSDQVQRLTEHPYLNYFPTPGFSVDGVKQHNEQGYRGSQVALIKPDSTIRILFLGGSTTYSYFTNESDSTFPELVRSSLLNNCKLGANNVEVINGGLPSGTSAELLTHYLFKFQYYNPDVVVVHSGGNDAIGNAVSGSPQPDLAHFRKNFVDPEPPPILVRWMLTSRFVSFFLIKLFYHRYTDGDHFGHTGEENPCRWFEVDTTVSVQREFNAFYRNIRTLVRLAEEDGAEVILVPFIVNEQFVKNEWSAIAVDYINGVAQNRIHLQEIANRQQVHFCNLTIEDIDDDRFWIDDCHLITAGISKKSQVVADCFCAINLIGGE